jgi:PAS domain S-box-containing protein
MAAAGQGQTDPNLRPKRSVLRSSIVRKLTMFVGVLVTLIGGVLIGVAYYATSAILGDQLNERLTTVAADRQEMLSTALREQEARARQLANRPRIHLLLGQRASGMIAPQRFRNETEALLGSARASMNGLLALWVQDDAGEVIASSGPEHLVTAFSKLTRSPASAGGSVVVPPRREGDAYAAAFAAEVRGRDGQALGTVVLLADFAPIVAFLIDPHGLGETGEVLAGIRDTERIRLILPPRLGFTSPDVAAGDMPALAAATAGRAGFARAPDYRGKNVLVAYRPVGFNFAGWGLIAKIESAEAEAPVRRLRVWLLVIGGVALAVGLVASNLIARQFSRPIRRLARTASALAAGDLGVRSQVSSNDEIGALAGAFNRMTEELARSHASLEERIQERTRDLEAVRELLDAFFLISTSRLDPQNIDKTYDSVLRFCARLGYDLAMISLVDHDAGVIRAARAMGTMTGVVELTVRRLEGVDILAVAVRENRVIVVPDSTLDPSCDQEAVKLANIRGQVVLPLVSDSVLGTLQVASAMPLDPATVDLRPLETLATHTARTLTGIRQLEEIRRLNQTLEQHAGDLARSEAALREQTRILRSVLDCMGDGVVVADSRGRFLVFNPAAERILGQARVDRPPQNWSRQYELYLPDRVTRCPLENLPLVRAIRGESVDQAELYIAYPSRADGTCILVSGRPLRDETGTVQGGVVVFHDITQRVKFERRLEAQYETTRVLAEADSPGQANREILKTICERLDWDFGAFWRLDPYTQRLRCAATYCRSPLLFPRFDAATLETPLEREAGLPGRVLADPQPAWIEEIGRDLNFPRQSIAVEEGLHTAVATPILLRGDCVGVLEFESREVRSAEPAFLEMMSSLGTQIGQFIDRQQMRGRVVQAEKLASLGMLSAGVAHEINNPLSYIANNLAVLERDVRFLFALLSAYEKARGSLAETHPEVIRETVRLAQEFDLPYVKENMGKLLQSTRQGMKRVADIVQNLRGFARVDRASVSKADIHEALKSALEMIQGRLDRRQITLEEHLGELPPVNGSPAQLNQVFLNLFVNAMQAIEATHRDDGRIAITAEAKQGEVVVEVADNGCGIPEDILPRIFNPFFTTKNVGDGTGLGLSITHSMVQDHGGRMEVESVPGHGSRFRVILPVARS